MGRERRGRGGEGERGRGVKGEERVKGGGGERGKGGRKKEKQGEEPWRGTEGENKREEMGGRREEKREGRVKGRRERERMEKKGCNKEGNKGKTRERRRGGGERKKGENNEEQWEKRKKKKQGKMGGEKTGEKRKKKGRRERQTTKCGYPASETSTHQHKKSSRTTNSPRNMSTIERRSLRPSSVSHHTHRVHHTANEKKNLSSQSESTRPSSQPGLIEWNHSRLFATHLPFLLTFSASACCTSFVFDPGTVFWRFSASIETSYSLQKSHDTLAADYKRQPVLSSLERHTFSRSTHDTGWLL